MTAVTFARPAFFAAIVAAAALISGTAMAHTPEQEQMCTSDAFRLCSDAIPDVQRVTACMIAKQSQLSSGCKAVFRYDGAPAAAPAPVSYKPGAQKPAKPLNIKPIKRG